MINYIFSSHLQLSNGNRLSLAPKIRPYVDGFPLNHCDYNSLMERDPNWGFSTPNMMIILQLWW
jgi:hypothetical protein